MKLTKELESQLKKYVEAGDTNGIMILQDSSGNHFSVKRVTFEDGSYYFYGYLNNCEDEIVLSLEKIFLERMYRLQKPDKSLREYVHHIEDNLEKYQFTDDKYEITLQETTKVNLSDKAIIVGIKGQHIATSKILTEIVEMVVFGYELTWGLSMILSSMANEADKAVKDKDVLSIVTSKIELNETNVFAELVNYEMNENMLKEVPHRRIADLAIIYRYSYSNFMDMTASSIIKWDNLKYIDADMTEEDLFKLTLCSANAKTQYTYCSLDKILEDKGCDFLDYRFSNEEPILHIITNEDNIFGASALAYPVIQQIAEDFDSDLIIIPSSIHEILFCRYDDAYVDYIKKCILEVNKNDVHIEDFLSNNAYKFERCTGLLTIL